MAFSRFSKGGNGSGERGRGDERRAGFALRGEANGFGRRSVGGVDCFFVPLSLTGENGLELEETRVVTARDFGIMEAVGRGCDRGGVVGRAGGLDKEGTGRDADVEALSAFTSAL